MIRELPDCDCGLDSPPPRVHVLGYHKFVYSGDRGVGSESPVVEGEGLLGHLPETI